jgi:hypothetical protein
LVQRRYLHRWSIVLLVLARLVLGEFAHAMPHEEPSNDWQVAAAEHAQELPCPDHAGTSDSSESPTDSEDLTSKSHDPASHSTHCCQNSCDCACLHLSALAISNVTAGVATTEQHLIPAAQLGHTPDRIFLLFRPPA